MMKLSHLDHLLEHTSDLLSRTIVDIGAGEGDFLIDATKRGATAIGVEINDPYIAKTQAKADQEGVSVSVVKGHAEQLPFSDEYAGFLNMSELIEHVQDPQQVLQEAHRVLKVGGRGYISVPNRFGIKDPHFHLYFVNWLPRRWANSFISLFGEHKIYDNEAGLQRLDEMHYYTYRQAKKLLKDNGFFVEDIRAEKVKIRFSLLSVFLLPVYYVARWFYFDTFHFLLKK